MDWKVPIAREIVLSLVLVAAVGLFSVAALPTLAPGLAARAAAEARQQLARAAYQGSGLKVRILLWAGVDPNAEVPGRTRPLDQAVLGGNPDTARYLIRNGANVNAREKFNCTPLTTAAYTGNTELVRLLLDNGADPDAVCDGRSALNLARTQGYLDTAALLAAYGAEDCSWEQDGHCA